MRSETHREIAKDLAHTCEFSWHLTGWDAYHASCAPAKINSSRNSTFGSITSTRRLKL